MSKNYYVYKLLNPYTGEFYFGSRGSIVNPKIDSYMGSPVTWKPDKERLIKVIMRTGFKSMSDSIEYEAKLIAESINHALSRNYYIPNKGFHTEGVIASKELRAKRSKNILGKIWVNNGIKAIQTYPDEIPKGFIRGRIGSFGHWNNGLKKSKRVKELIGIKLQKKVEVSKRCFKMNFDSIKKAAEFIKYDRSGLSKVCRGINKTAKTYNIKYI